MDTLAGILPLTENIINKVLFFDVNYIIKTILCNIFIYVNIYI